MKMPKVPCQYITVAAYLYEFMCHWQRLIRGKPYQRYKNPDYIHNMKRTVIAVNHIHHLFVHLVQGNNILLAFLLFKIKTSK